MMRVMDNVRKINLSREIMESNLIQREQAKNQFPRIHLSQKEMKKIHEQVKG
jgi:hypothetical protein